jgi:hypothetical protein
MRDRFWEWRVEHGALTWWLVVFPLTLAGFFLWLGQTDGWARLIPCALGPVTLLLGLFWMGAVWRDDDE